jgi:pyrimidine operon attenuation protein/uracil phosphoribosyltransferase
MQKKPILEQELLEITLKRLSQQIIENHLKSSDSVALGLQPRGRFFAERLVRVLHEDFGVDLPLGLLDTTFHRDDFRRRDSPKMASSTDIPFIIEDKNVLLIDDVLYTGRSVRAALDAMITFGRPKKVELMVLIDRKYSRDLPVEAKYVGKKVNTMKDQTVIVEWKEQGFDEDNVWLMDKE